MPAPRFVAIEAAFTIVIVPIAIIVPANVVDIILHTCRAGGLVRIFTDFRQAHVLIGDSQSVCPRPRGVGQRRVVGHDIEAHAGPGRPAKVRRVNDTIIGIMIVLYLFLAL